MRNNQLRNRMQPLQETERDTGGTRSLVTGIKLLFAYTGTLPHETITLGYLQLRGEGKANE